MYDRCLPVGVDAGVPQYITVLGMPMGEARDGAAMGEEHDFLERFQGAGSKTPLASRVFPARDECSCTQPRLVSRFSWIPSAVLSWF